MYAVIMAGGKGARFWPESREAKPKQFLNLAGEKTLIEQTVDRVLPLVPLENILIVIGDAHRKEVTRLLPDLPRQNILVEPMGRNTAPCIGLAALHIQQRDPDAVMMVLPADHLILDEDAFRDRLKDAVDLAQKSPVLVTVGITPLAPETGYGYIERGEPCTGSSAFSVASFREKPDLEQARSFLDRGTFLWNSGMFVWTVASIMAALESFLPDLHEKLLGLRKHLGTAGEEAALQKVYEKISSVSIDYGIMEKAGNVLALAGNFGWNDLGSWDALADVYPRDEDGIGRRGSVVAIDSRNSLAFGGDKLIALVGVDDLVVVESDNAILVMKRGRSQDVRQVVDHLETTTMKEYL